MSGTSFIRLSGRMPEIQACSRSAAHRVMRSQAALQSIARDDDFQRGSFEQPGATVIDMIGLKARHSPNKSVDPKNDEVRANPAAACVSREIAESNASASAAWLLAGRSVSQLSRTSGEAGDPSPVCNVGRKVPAWHGQQ